MASTNFQPCLTQVLKYEGGYVDHSSDPGGATNMGITQATLASWRRRSVTKTEVRNLTKAEATDIYRARYWNPLSGDSLRAGDDLAVFDFGVNSGVSRSAKYSQAIAGVEQDGKIGPVTLAAIARMSSRDFIKRLCAKRLGFVQSLAIWNTFGRGWSRRIADVEATALSWVSTKSQLDQDARDAQGAATGQGGAVIGVGGAGAADQAMGVTGLPIWAVIAIIAVIAVPLVIGLVVNAQRAAALKKVARNA